MKCLNHHNIPIVILEHNPNTPNSLFGYKCTIHICSASRVEGGGGGGEGVQLSEFFFGSLIDRPLNSHHGAKEIVASLTIWLWTNSLQSCHIHQATYPNCCISSYMRSVLRRLIVISFFRV